MKRTNFFLTTMLVLLIGAQAFGQTLTTPQVSPKGKVYQAVGISKIGIVYSRPAVKDREVWGKLVAFDSPWRAGANENTVITFSHDVKIEGEDLAAGTYGLHMIPSEKGDWTVMFSHNSTSWGSFSYDEAEDALRVSVSPKESDHHELLSYDVIPWSDSKATVALSWADKTIPIGVSLSTPDIVMANMKNELRSLAGFSWQGWNQAASYCAKQKINEEEALAWSEKAVKMGGGFTAMNTHAQLLTANGEAEKAEKYMAKAMNKANMAELNAYGYQLLGQGKHDKAIKVFKLNVEKHPQDANIHDSLGEGLVIRDAPGDKKEAIKNFKKSLAMNPPENTRQNSLKYLRELGVEMEDTATAKKN